MSHLGPVLTGTAVVQVGRAGWQRQRWSHFAESSGLRVRWPMSIPVSMASSKLITTQGDSTYSESSVRCQLTVCLLSLGYREGMCTREKIILREPPPTPCPHAAPQCVSEHHLGRVSWALPGGWMLLLAGVLLSEQAGGGQGPGMKDDWTPLCPSGGHQIPLSSPWCVYTIWTTQRI